MRFAIIKDNKVVNIIEADENFIIENNLDAIDITDKICGLGFSYLDDEFIPPPSIADTDNGKTL